MTGDLAGAAKAVPFISEAAITQHYSEAFTVLLMLLGAVTVVTSIVVMLFLRKEQTGESSTNISGCESVSSS